MFIGDLLNSGAMPVLEMTARFAGQRQGVLAHTIANIDTPDFRPLDVSPGAFQRMLREAVDRRREAGPGAALEWEETREVERGGPAPFDLRLIPRTPSGNILFHDRNNRDLERLMQAQAENAGAFRVATDLLRSRFQQLGAAIGERV